VLPLEIGIHFIDLACVVAGAVERFDRVDVTDDAYTGATAALSATGRSSGDALRGVEPIRHWDRA
jgi:hypothetical protein